MSRTTVSELKNVVGVLDDVIDAVSQNKPLSVTKARELKVARDAAANAHEQCWRRTQKVSAVPD